VSDLLADPTLTIYDDNGGVIASNDNWQDDVHSDDVVQQGLAPLDAHESAIVLRLPAGAYSAIIRGADSSEGVGLFEVYSLP
jgi:hypothetical protein